MNTYGFFFVEAPAMYANYVEVEPRGYSRSPFAPGVKAVVVKMVSGEFEVIPNPRATFISSEGSMTVQAHDPKNTKRDVHYIVAHVDENDTFYQV